MLCTWQEEHANKKHQTKEKSTKRRRAPLSNISIKFVETLKASGSCINKNCPFLCFIINK